MASMSKRKRPGPSVVLVIEDDPLLMLSLVDFVEDAGCEAVEAFTVAEAIGILESRTDIRTVFADLDMRGSVSGMQLMLSVRDRWPPIELLMVGSHPVPPADLPHRGVLLGKPFDERKIVAAIRKVAA